MGCSDSGYVDADNVAEFLGKLEGFDYHSMPLKEDVDDYIVYGAARINASLAATGQCDCSFSSWGNTLLEELNLIATSLLIYGRCGVGFTEDQRGFWEDWLASQLELMRTGEIDLCEDATGPNFPAYGTATRAITTFQQAQLIANDILRNQ